MPSFLEDYEPVENRIRAFWQEHPAGRIVTDLVTFGGGHYIVKALVYRGDELRDNPPAATGLAHESESDRGVNSTSALENCETSAIGRALANLGYAAKGKRPSREEMRKTSAAQPSGEVEPGPEDSGTGEGPKVQAQPSSVHPGREHVWMQSPRVPTLEVCKLSDCIVTRKIA